jgi:hypothetical protein
MSKKATLKRKHGGDPYKRGYANGVLAAVDALFDDLAERGDLDDVNYVDHGDGEQRAEVCTGCLLASKGFQHTYDRWSFVIGIDGH